jgi:hypothetical protein
MEYCEPDWNVEEIVDIDALIDKEFDEINDIDIVRAMLDYQHNPNWGLTN